MIDDDEGVGTYISDGLSTICITCPEHHRAIPEGLNSRQIRNGKDVR